MCVCWSPCDCCELCSAKNSKLISCCCDDEQNRKPASPYVTRVALAGMKQSCAGTDHLSITDDMLLWTPAEARRYFESAGRERPNFAPGFRSLDDQAPPTNRDGHVDGPIAGLEMQR